MINFKSKFDENVTNALSKHQLKKVGWALGVISLFFTVFGVLCIVFREDASDLSLGIFLIAFGLLYFPLVLGLSKVFQKKWNKSMSIMSADTEIEFSFDEERCTIIQIKGDEYKGVTEAKYVCFYKVIETKENYFLYISKSQSHVVNKKDLVDGSIEELNEILSKNLDVKFKQYKTKIKTQEFGGLN